MAKPRRAKNAHTSDRVRSQLDDRSERRQALLEKARLGSNESLGDLLDDHVPMMRSFFSRQMSAELRAETTPLDLVQDAFVKALDGFAKLIGSQAAQFTDWLMTICGNVLADLQRKYQRAGVHEFTPDKPLDELELEAGSQHGDGRRRASPDEILEALETAGQLLAALNQLPADERQIVIWRVVKRLTFAEIAARLLFSADAVERSFKRALSALRNRVAQFAFA
ncbi:MAG: RNA polymerase sigma factor [Pirellulales bacterium]